jgi:hypothetical protein
MHISNIFNDQNVLSLHVTPDGSSGTLIIAGTFDGLWISTNNGNDWIESNNGLLSTFIVSLGAIQNTSGGPTLFAGTGAGVYRSTNNGVSWIEANNGLTNLDVQTFTSSGQNIFAGTIGGGVCISTNNGASWAAVNNGLTNTTVWRVFALPGLPGNILAGTNLGIFHSSNDGQTWSSISSGLPPSPSHSSSIVRVFAINVITDGSEQYLVAGTEGRGVWKRPLSEVITSVTPISGIVPAEFSLKQNFPNPFNPQTVISFTLPKSNTVTLRVFNVLGEEIAMLVNEHLKPGTYEIKWDAENFPSGVYYYKLQAGSFVETKKMVLIK